MGSLIESISCVRNVNNIVRRITYSTRTLGSGGVHFVTDIKLKRVSGRQIEELVFIVTTYYVHTAQRMRMYWSYYVVLSSTYSHKYVV